MRMKKIPYLLSLMMLCITGVNAQTTGEEFDYEKIAITPADRSTVESLSTFTITFNNYMVEAGDDAKAYLFNEETEEEINGSVYDMGGKGVYVMLDKEVTTAGEWQLNIEGVKKLIDDSDVELIFTYTIGQNVVDGVISAKNAADGLNGAAIYNLQGQKLNKAQKGLNIVNGKKMYMK